jgi:alkylated DNA repair dioxygenase AlkB
MELFPNIIDPDRNLLPYDGAVNYFGQVFSDIDANNYYQELLNNIAWEHDQAVIFGKKIITKRKVAWYGEREFNYTYSNTTKLALPWTPVLEELKNQTEMLSKATFNSCLLNLYHSGEEGMAWHSDGETDLEPEGAIASLSFGAIRKFCFKHKQSKEKVCLTLDHGSLLIMKGSTQAHWLHRLPPTKKVREPRVNLTFRTIVNQ